MVCDCESLQITPYLEDRSLIYADFCLTGGNVTIASLFVPTKANKNYWYHGGVNVQAVIAYLIGIALPFPGFCGELGAKVSSSAAHIMDIAWLTAFMTSFVSYYVICTFWPTSSMRNVKERRLAREQLAPEDDYYDSAMTKDEEMTDVATSTGGFYGNEGNDLPKAFSERKFAVE